MKRREVLLALALLLLGAVGAFLVKFFNWSGNSKADLSELSLFKRCMEELSETMIPETETPGAKSAGVAASVFLLVEHCLNGRDQSVFLKGLQDLDNYCKDKFGLSFVSCGQKERLSTLYVFESRATFGGWLVTKVRQRLFGKPFIILAKELCVLCYCRSMQGATLALVYDPIPGSYTGCIKLGEKQRSWALT
ncbi:MAG: gluconate 2-dehydrogenase subunit 3 family protein [Parapedobacter sp.]